MVNVGLIEEMGAYAVWASERNMYFREYSSTYPDKEVGWIPDEPEGLRDRFTFLTFIAANN